MTNFFQSNSVVIDASQSNDPVGLISIPSIYSWSCAQNINNTMKKCPHLLNDYISSINTTHFSIPFDVPVGIYRFYLNFTKGSRSAFTYVDIQFVSYIPPLVSINNLLPLINRSDKLSIIAECFGKCQWIVVYGNFTLKDEYILTKCTSNMT